MNIILAISYRYFLIVAIVFVVGCSHPLKISGEGDIVSSSGTHSCTLESQPCVNFVANDYKETYTAVARVGYKFVEWQGCGDQFPNCSFDIKAEVVNQYWFQTMPALTAIFSKKDSEKDISPDRFSFIDQTGVLLNLERISAGIKVSGIDGPAPISIVGGKYSINDHEFTRSVGTVNNGDVIRVSTFSSMSFSTSTRTILNIGGIIDDFVTSTVSEAVGLSPTLGTSYVVDETLSLILYNGAEFELGSSLIIGLEIVEIHTSDRTLIKGKAYSINYKGYPFVLYRTALPII
jgi:hypothetical protein